MSPHRAGVGTATLPYSGRIRARDHDSPRSVVSPGLLELAPSDPVGGAFLHAMLRSPAEHIQLPAPLEGALDHVHEWLVNIARGRTPSSISVIFGQFC
jgi:hypothetical protein